MRDLVEGVTVRKPAACSTIDIAREYGKKHDDLLKKVRIYIDDDANTVFTRANIINGLYLDGRGARRKAYGLSERQKSYLIFGFNSRTATQYKCRFLESAIDG